MRSEEARELLAYDDWANEGMARVLEKAATLPAKIRSTWAHLAATEDLWYARCAGDDYKRIAVWPDIDVPEASKRARAANRRWREMVNAVSDHDFARRVTFTNSRGEPCADEVGHIVRHLVNHGTHHRAQIALILRESGIEPANLDYIIFCRQRDSR
jgi:uncharacterized damage-inducible protein DinB